ncbi:MAG: peptide chain release factor N(5)-glutamine methyltransferase [Patescibacteria group bacterium]
MTIGELQKIFLAPSSEARIAPEDFFVLLAHATGEHKVFLLAHPEYEPDGDSEMRAREFFLRRLNREPVAYITGRKEFYGRDFVVTSDTLIPRPETEHMVELVLNETESRVKDQGSGSGRKILIADIGTGSGNIIISIASELMRSHARCSIRNATFTFTLHASDISADALAVAKQNAARHAVDGIIGFHEGDLLAPVQDAIAAADELIIAANLPYLSEEIYQAAEDTVKSFEPRSALLSGKTGLDHYDRLLDQTASLSKPVILFLEISPEQAPLLQASLATRFPHATVSVFQDLSGQDRIVRICLSRALQTTDNKTKTPSASVS